MKTTFGMTAAALLTLTFGATMAYAQEMPATAPAANDSSETVNTTQDANVSHNSKVRIVRLSEVKGAVQLDRATGVGFEAAMVNLPIIEKSRLKTGDGVAEIEFEDNSTLRVTTDSEVEFPRLEMLPSGAQASTVRVLKGTVYVSLVSTKGTDFVVTFGEQKLLLRPSTHIRLELGKDEAQLAVLDGSGQVESSSGAMTELSKKRTFTFNMSSPGEPTMAKNVAEEPLDSWDKNASDYHKRYANMTAFSGGSGYSYGGSDMSYYGSYMNASGCGQMWRPYLASAAWDPYSNGTWAYYQNAGYSWVSPYPWGWTPFHTGSWSYCSGTGWGWMPGGSWNGLNNMPSSISPTASGPVTHRPIPPRRVNLGASSTLIAVNTKPLTHSTLTGGTTFTFRNDSAGMGIPRGSLGKLDKVSQQASQHGFATTTVAIYTPASYQVAGTGGVAANRTGSGATARSGVATGSARSGASSSAAHSAGSNSSSSSSASSGAASAPSFSGSMSSGGMSSGSHGGGGAGGGSRTH